MDRILLVPSFKTPLKKEEDETDPQSRVEMLLKVVKKYPFMELDQQEILRKGLSYTYKTIQELSKQRVDEELFFIMGLDQFYFFDQWKNYEKILEKAHLIVTSRPGFSFPKSLADLPKGLQPLVKQKKSFGLELNLLQRPGFQKKAQAEKSVVSKIYFCPLKDMDISSFYIRSGIKQSKDVSHLLLKELNQYIIKNKLYKKESFIGKEARSLIQPALKELKKKKAYDVKTYDLRSKPLPFSFAVIAISSNVRQTKTLADHLKKTIKKNLGLIPLNEEGREESRWIVLDYGDCIFHIFYDYTGRFYNLEALWESCLIDLE